MEERHSGMESAVEVAKMAEVRAPLSADGGRSPLRRILAAAAIALGLVAALFFRADRGALALVEWVRGAGAAGALVFAAAYVVATVAFLPGSILTLAAGFLYGPVVGTLIVSPASVAGATLAFLLGRTVARGWISARVSGNPRFSAVDRAVGQNGLKIVTLIRLSPLFPFNLLNYALGLTRVSTRDYVLGSLVGMFPGTLLYVYLGSALTSAGELFSGRPGAGGAGSVLYWIGLVATAVVTVVVTRLARQAVREAVEEEARA